MSEGQKVTPQYMHLKAGMDSVNKQAIAKKIAEMTAGTPKDLHQKQLEKKRKLQIAEMLERVMKFTTEQRKAMRDEWSKKIQKISLERNLKQYWAHFDFDMFYVACELLDKQELKDQPCGVGSQDGVLCTANYAARALGVRSAMPTFIAKSVCPQLVLLPPDFTKYRHYSQIFRQTLGNYDQNLQSHGLDQAYVKMTPYLFDKSQQQQGIFIADIRKQIFNKTGLTVSCGVGANKMLAKMASEVNKPNNQFILPNEADQILQFMKGIKIRKIPGIGPVNEYFLKGLGIQCSQDILDNTDVLQVCFSTKSCEFFIEAALGLGQIQHTFKQRKSVGRSQTFKPTCDIKFLVPKLKQLCSTVSTDLEELGFLSNNVVLSYQNESYQKKDKTFSLDKFTKDKQDLQKAVYKFFDMNILTPKKKIRLLGIRTTHLMKIQQWKRKSLINYFQKNSLKPGTQINATEGQQSIIKEIRQQSNFICPICDKHIECMNNLSALNRHIDKCLVGEADSQNLQSKKIQQVALQERAIQELDDPQINQSTEKKQIISTARSQKSSKTSKRGRKTKNISKNNERLSAYFKKKEQQ